MSGHSFDFEHATQSIPSFSPNRHRFGAEPPTPTDPPRPAAVSTEEDAVLLGRLARARTLGLAALSVLTAALVATGGLLFFAYAPTDVGATGASAAVGRTLSDLHLVLAWLAVFVAIFTGAAVVFERGLVRRWFSASLGPLTALVALASLVTGLMLAWNDLALPGGGEGRSTRGYGFLLGDRRGVVLTDYGQVSVASLAAGMSLHLIAGVSLAIAAAMVWQLRNEPAAPLTQVQEAERLARRAGSAF